MRGPAGGEKGAQAEAARQPHNHALNDYTAPCLALQVERAAAGGKKGAQAEDVRQPYSDALSECSTLCLALQVERAAAGGKKGAQAEDIKQPHNALAVRLRQRDPGFTTGESARFSLLGGARMCLFHASAAQALCCKASAAQRLGARPGRLLPAPMLLAQLHILPQQCPPGALQRWGQRLPYLHSQRIYTLTNLPTCISCLCSAGPAPALRAAGGEGQAG